MDPRDPRFSGDGCARHRSRYDPSFRPPPPPPSHHFPDHPPPPNNYYPHPQFHPPPPPPPPPRHHPHPHPHPHPDNDPGLYFPHPHDHHHPRPYDHPPPPTVSARGPHHRDHWDGGAAADPRRSRDFDDRPPRPEPAQLDWDHSDLARRRHRMREDGILEEDDFRDRQLQQLFNSLGMMEDGILEEDFDPRDSSGFDRRIPMQMAMTMPPPPPPRSFAQQHPFHDVEVYSVGIGNSEIGFQATRYAANRGSEEGFQATRYAANIGSEEGFQENHYKGKRKWTNSGNENDGFQENHFKGKRWNFNGGNSQRNAWSSSERSGQKASALGRIQSGISVWSRIEEKPPSSAPDFSHLGFLEENQPEIDSLDLSYKSNALVAKVMVPSIPDLQPSAVVTSPRVVVPKDRMKAKKVAKDREQVVIPIVSSSVVSGVVEGVSKNAILRSSQVSNSLDVSKIEKGSSSKLASDGSKKENGSFSKSASDGSKKAVGSFSKPAGNVPKKAIGSSSKPASDGSKKLASSSSKPSGGSRSQPSAKKVAKVTPVNKVAAKKSIKTVEKNISEDCRQEDKVSESKPTNHTSSELSQPGPMVGTTSIDNSASQSSKDVNFVYWPMELAPPLEDNTTEQSIKTDTLVHGSMAVTTSIENSVTEQSCKEMNLVQGPMVALSENITAEQSMKDSNSLQASTVGTTSSEKNPTEWSGKDDNVVQEPMVATPSIENSGTEHSSKNVNLANVVDYTVKEETMMLVEKTAPKSTHPVVSDPRIVIDVSSESSPEEVTIIRSPSKPIWSISDVNAKDFNEEMDVGNPSKSDAEVALSSVNESSPPKLASDAQVTVSVATLSSPTFYASLRDENVKRKRERIEKHHKIEVPSFRDELEVHGEQMNENSYVLLPSDASKLVQDQNPPNDATDKEDYDLRLPDKFLPMSDSRPPILQDGSVNIVMSERVKQLLPSSPSQKGTLTDVSRNQYASTFIMEKQSNSQLTETKCHDQNENTNKQEEKASSNNGSLLVSKGLLALEAEPETKSDKTIQYHHPTSQKTQTLQSYEPNKQISTDSKLTGVATCTMFILSSGVPRASGSKLSSTGLLKETARSSHNARNKTWHRTDTPPASPLHGNLQSTVGTYKQSTKKQSPKKLERALNSSYVRKGNSLIRKPANILPPIPPHGLDAASRKSHLTERNMTSGNIDNTLSHKTCSNPSLERPKTPPLSIGSKFQMEFPEPTSEEPVPEPGVESQAKPVEGQTLELLSGSVDDQSITDDIKSEALTRKRMTYVKRKSNQLVAAPPTGFGDSSAHPTEKTEKLSSSSTSSDLYYMRKKNQLILNALSSDSQHKQDGIVPVDNSNSDDHGASNVFSLEYSRTGLFNKRLDKVLRKTHKHSKFSRVWTLGGQSVKRGVTSLNCWKVMPYLFPWKRTAYSSFSTNKAVLNSNRGSLSSVSRKLQLMRKRDTIYTVSNDGFSLKKAGVVSIGGSSLKWSKSIERHSKKANEEATLAVAEVEREKRERKKKRPIASCAKNRHSFRRKSTPGIELQHGERIYRVGSVRYKMDASKRTLIRIPDEQSPGAVGQQTGKNTFVPRRLLIGNDEYIRIGNGNQLVRDPKKLIRMLASEKIRRSLHTARQRLAKKQQYCQFFTRFGKCNKNSGKCPYIHDPGKVAICTKFLRGVCTDANCKLTHQIIPERMPDCSYFLQGLCTNINCPYRHVHVNPKASVCDGFLRGYCADGDECHKKHSYVCLLFEATGKCPQGSKCKLHHPKSRNKSKKWKRCEIQNNSRIRYFGSKIIKLGESLAVNSDKCAMEKVTDPFCYDGCFADFISIDADSDDNDGVQTNVAEDYNTKESESDLSDMHPDELDAVIKPVRIMNKANLPSALITC